MEVFYIGFYQIFVLINFQKLISLYIIKAECICLLFKIFNWNVIDFNDFIVIDMSYLG